jgi:uncharacterized protein (TIRG00374 family)
VGRWLGVLVSLALLAWVLSAFDLSEVGRALREAEYWYLLPVAGLALVNYAARALRWGTLFRRDEAPRRSSLFVALMIGYLANNVLPARAGEFVRVYVLSRREGMARSKALATVVVERVVDLVVLLLLLALVLLVYPFPVWLRRAGFVVGAASLAGLVSLLVLNVRGTALVGWGVRRLKFLPEGLRGRVEAVGHGFVGGVSGLRGGWRALAFFGCTAFIWGLELLTTMLIAQMFRLPVTATGLLFVMLVIGLGTMVPSSPGYVGTYEFFATSALGVLGVTGGRALGFAVTTHAVIFIGASAVGALCLALERFELSSLARQASDAG